MKLSASALSQFLRSPKAFWYRYIARLEPIQQSVTTFDHDKLLGIVWAQYTDRFYKHVGEAQNASQTRQAWLEGTEGWVPEKARDRLTKALDGLMPHYYQMFSPSDGCRTAGSELWVENDRFCGKLDGLSDEGIVHEVKTTSRAPQLSEQQWKVEHSIQVKLYCILADAKGYQVEFGYKDPPHSIYRCPVAYVTDAQKQGWEQELNALADTIYSLGDDPNQYPCHTDGCCMVSKGMVSMCGYQLLCDQGLNETTKVFYKPKEHRK
jgi:CRISPR/Cas system-associated exonuclease Cas4 (RecB family)